MFPNAIIKSRKHFSGQKLHRELFFMYTEDLKLNTKSRSQIKAFVSYYCQTDLCPIVDDLPFCKLPKPSRNTPLPSPHYFVFLFTLNIPV